jgi:hypothetical protein
MKKVGIIASNTSSRFRKLLSYLGSSLGVHFEERSFGNNYGIDAWLFIENTPAVMVNISNAELPCYTIIYGDQLVDCGVSSTIEFSHHNILPSVLSGRKITVGEVAEVKALPQWLENVTMLAYKEGSPLWAVQEAKGYHHHFVSFPVPEMDEGDLLFQHFHGNKFISLIPLLIFLRILSEDRSWEPPRIQACFMFDDPNLHYKTYGFINFTDIKNHAQLFNYHVTFATIPLDSWYVHKQTAFLFRQHSNCLSLLIHGNDHVFKELGRPYSHGECRNILQQALIRTARLEKRSGVDVSRVMVPPHGACTEDVLAEMARLGFEAVCVSSGSLCKYNQQANWLFTFGLKPCEIISGLTVIPRINMNQICHNNILVAALLFQPIILRGHHHDIAEGPKLLGDLSEYINTLGNVRWGDMKSISRAHYSRKYDGNFLHIRMFTKRVEIFIPEGIDQISVEREWLKGENNEKLAWRIPGQKSDWTLVRRSDSIPAISGKVIEIISNPSQPFTIDNKHIREFHLWPLVRRNITEARDRIAPLMKRVSVSS